MDSSRDDNVAQSLKNKPLPTKVLFTGYLCVIGVGLMMAGVQIFLTHGMADGKFGLSVDDIVYSYYGNRDNSRLEVKLKGNMKDHASSQDRATIIKWVRLGSSQQEYESTTKAIFDKNCVKCHGGVPGLTPLMTYDQIKPLAEIDMGASIDSLARVSHIHLFGIAFIFFFVCQIFSHASGIPTKFKAICIGCPFAFLLIDILSWWLIKWYPLFAWMEIVAGFCNMLAAATMILISLYQMWVLPHRQAI